MRSTVDNNPFDPPVIQALKRYQAQLARNEAAAMGRLIRNWQSSYQRLQTMLNALLYEIGDNPITKGQLVRMRRYGMLLEQVAREMDALGVLTQNEVAEAAKFGIDLGTTSATQLISGEIVGDATIATMFNVLPKNQVVTLLGFLQPNSALYQRLQMLAPFATEAVSTAFVEGVTLGFNPRKIAALVESMFGRGLVDALRFVRTAQIWAYRETSRANFIANEQVVEGWVWYCALDDRVCGSCVAMHGSVHLLSEPLNDHFNGRCAMLPKVLGYEDLQEIQPGQAWFEEQTETFQRELLGRGKYNAWSEGLFDFSDLVDFYDSDVYGEMRIEKPLWKLLGQESPRAKT